VTRIFSLAYASDTFTTACYVHDRRWPYLRLYERAAQKGNCITRMRTREGRPSLSSNFREFRASKKKKKKKKKRRLEIARIESRPFGFFRLEITLPLAILCRFTIAEIGSSKRHRSRFSSKGKRPLRRLLRRPDGPFSTGREKGKGRSMFYENSLSLSFSPRSPMVRSR